MAYRSWLKDVRRVDDLARWLHHFPTHSREWDRQWEYEKRGIDYIENPHRPSQLNSDSYRYFEGWLHDGHVFGVEHEGNRLEISIQNELLEIFCTDYFAEIEEDRELVLSPVRLTFEGVNYVNAVRPDPEGWLKWDDWTSWRPVEDLRYTDQFIRGWFHEQDGKIQWVGHFHKLSEKRRNQDSSLFILVDCESACARPESERVLRNKIGDKAYEVWSYFSGLPDREDWGRHGYLRRYLTEQGTPVRHIPDQSER